MKHQEQNVVIKKQIRTQMFGEKNVDTEKLRRVLSDWRTSLPFIS